MLELNTTWRSRRCDRTPGFWCAAAVALVLSVLPANRAAAADTLRIGIGTRVAASPLHVAAERGYFERENVAVTLIAMDDDGLLDGLADGEIDLATRSADFLLQAEASSLSMRGAFIIAQSGDADALIAHPDVQDTRRLSGRRVAVTPGTPGELLLRDALQRKGRRLRNVTVVRLDQAAAADALQTGDVDAAVLHGPVLAAVERHAVDHGDGDRPLRVLTRAADRPGMISDLLVGSEELLARDKARVQAVIRAIDSAVNWMRRHPQESAALLTSHYTANAEDTLSSLAGTEFLDVDANMAALRGDFQKEFSRMSEVLDSDGDGRAREVPSANRFLALSALRQVAARR